MSEDRFAGLDLDDSFGADYVAKKQEPEPAKEEMSRQIVFRPGTANNDINPYSQLAFGGTTQNALAGVGSGLNSYVAPSYGQDYGQRQRIVDRRVEWDAVTDGYLVWVVRFDGSASKYRVNTREEAYAIG